MVRSFSCPGRTRVPLGKLSSDLRATWAMELSSSIISAIPSWSTSTSSMYTISVRARVFRLHAACPKSKGSRFDFTMWKLYLLWYYKVGNSNIDVLLWYLINFSTRSICTSTCPNMPGLDAACKETQNKRSTAGRGYLRNMWWGVRFLLRQQCVKWWDKRWRQIWCKNYARL